MKKLPATVRAVILVAALTLSLIGLLLFLGLTGTVHAQPAVYCPIRITKGDVWIDTFPLSLQNTGNGVALGIQIMNSYPVMGPPGPWGGRRRGGNHDQQLPGLGQAGPGSGREDYGSPGAANELMVRGGGGLCPAVKGDAVRPV